MDEALRQELTLGREYYLKGDHAKARDYLERVADKAPTFADVFNMLGMIYHGLGQFSKAQRAFEQALKINPAYSEVALNLSVLYNDLGKYDEARAIYNHALQISKHGRSELDPFIAGKLANMHGDVGEAYLSAGMYQEAIEQYRQALGLRSTFLGNALRDSGDMQGAILEYERILREKPDYLPARLALGLAYYARGQKEKAVGEWTDILRREPNHERAKIYLQMAGHS
jgi:tetratricopeptide (TPR) repeat protein